MKIENTRAWFTRADVEAMAWSGERDPLIVAVDEALAPFDDYARELREAGEPVPAWLAKPGDAVLPPDFRIGPQQVRTLPGREGWIPARIADRVWEHIESIGAGSRLRTGGLTAGL